MALHSSTLAWKIPWTEEPGRLQSMGLLRVRYDWATSLSLSLIGEGNGNPLQCSCLENPRDGGAWWAAVYGVVLSRTRLKWLGSNNEQLQRPGQSTCFYSNRPSSWQVRGARIQVFIERHGKECCVTSGFQGPGWLYPASLASRRGQGIIRADLSALPCSAWICFPNSSVLETSLPTSPWEHCNKKWN